MFFGSLRVMFLAVFFMPTLSAQQLNADQLLHLHQNVTSLTDDPAYGEIDWSAVIEDMADRRILALGEFTHGSGEVFATRNELAMTLCEKLGIDLILFEAGLGEMAAVNLTKDTLDARGLLSGFFGPWNKVEFVDLMQYTREKNIEVGGFDVQRTGDNFTTYLAKRLGDTTNFPSLEERFVAIKRKLANYRTEYPTVAEETLDIVAAYTRLRDAAAHETFIRRTLDNRIAFLNYMLRFTRDKNWNDRWKARDSIMADNVLWMLSRYAPEKKAILIAHNYHISRYNEREEVMGEYLAHELGDQLYTLGVFGGQGTYHDNAGREKTMLPADTSSLDIKHIIIADGTPFGFLPASSSEKPGGEWMRSPIKINDTFIDLSGGSTLMIPRCFDGLLLLDTVSPPHGL